MYFIIIFLRFYFKEKICLSSQLRGVREPFTIVTFQLYLNSGFLGVSKLYEHKDHINYQIMLKISYIFFISVHMCGLIKTFQEQLYFMCHPKKSPTFYH